MPKPMIRIHNAQTDEVIDREMTADEFKAYQAEQAAFNAKATAEEDKAAAKAALLDRLGITAEEAQLLLG
jgi:hypothetical protein